MMADGLPSDNQPLGSPTYPSAGEALVTPDRNQTTTLDGELSEEASRIFSENGPSEGADYVASSATDDVQTSTIAAAPTVSAGSHFRGNQFSRSSKVLSSRQVNNDGSSNSIDEISSGARIV